MTRGALSGWSVPFVLSAAVVPCAAHAAPVSDTPTATVVCQPNTDAFDDVQIRVSDGSVIFTPVLSAPDVQIEDATYRMFAIDGGVKYRGFSFDAEHYRRCIDNFSMQGSAGRDRRSS